MSCSMLKSIEGSEFCDAWWEVRLEDLLVSPELVAALALPSTAPDAAFEVEPSAVADAAAFAACLRAFWICFSRSDVDGPLPFAARAIRSSVLIPFFFGGGFSPSPPAAAEAIDGIDAEVARLLDGACCEDRPLVEAMT